MSVSSETDPVDFVRLALDDDTNTWSTHGSEPDFIERAEAVEPPTKENRASNGKTAVYVWSPEVGPIDVMGAEGDDYEDGEVVQCDVMTADEDTTNDIVDDVIQLLFDYYVDNEQNSQWVDVRPTGTGDNTADAFYTGAHRVISVQASLTGVRSIT